ncbi:MBL fold metallo-hydrolase [Oceanobacillus chungangensis]|uniref:MBL fold metallo-hydrolase n=1 Tax=Oceanobacillus chungangensis TaxID=1229152 RepID=A0A3D8PJW6_9BACI|nr:MBL fold metallo-hydrolase [Oceanobacillus chungangensis]RDW15475.1 MBL fold metallo-hydrolase [Oceanobacillus chungangensis]
MKLIFSIILSVLLVACGQGVEQEAVSENPLDEAKPQSEETENSEEKETAEEASNTEATSATAEIPAASQTSEETSSNANLNELKVHYIDAGQANATLFQYSDQQDSYTILYDTGDWNRNEVVNYLANQNISTIDLIIVSHPDADHIGQLAEIVRTYDTGEVWLSGNESSSETFQNAIEAVIASDADYHEPRTGESFDIGPLKLDVLYPTSISGKTNEESISILFTYGNTKFLFTGDAGKSEELEMIGTRIDIEADILQLGHHGSNTSTDKAFLQAVSPSIAIYSAGLDNSYGHPSQEVVSTVLNEGIELYGTDVNGTIIVTTDGEDYSIATNKDGTISPSSTGSANTFNEDNNLNEENEETTTGVASCININRASIDEVQAIIHIGPERAQDLFDMRPYDSVDGLSRIKGIGPARITDIKNEGIACVGG